MLVDVGLSWWMLIDVSGCRLVLVGVGLCWWMQHGT